MCLSTTLKTIIKPANYYLLVFSCLVFLISPVVSAHHSHASLDRNNIQLHKGVVTKFSWKMPHVFLGVNAPNSEGKVVEYFIELLHPPGMKEKGWSRDSFKPGDLITWEGAADKNPNRYYSGLNWAEKGDGSRLTMDGSNTAPVQPSTDFTGLWVRDTARFGYTYRPVPEWPYTDYAMSQVNNFSELQNPQLDCLDPGPPKSTILPYPIQIERPDSETVILDYEGADHTRVISLNSELVLGAPSKLGQSRGWFEGDVLVVETDNFVADDWGSYTGVDSSDQKHLLERFSLVSDGMGLRIEITLTDPVMFKAPVTIDYYMKKLADRELVKVECTVENSRLYINAGL
ncbi:DUF6152 family protein [Gammaproteobacteria bacterium]|nr:DUF6152 family protein [Gammaproteobacteria bacterium]